ESLDSGLRRSDEDVIALPWMWRRSTFFVVPAPGRDPDTRPARHAREAWAPASAGATRMESRCLGSGDTQHSSSSRRQAGIQTQDRRAMRAKPIGVGEQYRCSPPSEPYGRFSRIRLSGQWLSTSRLALKSVS